MYPKTIQLLNGKKMNGFGSLNGTVVLTDYIGKFYTVTKDVPKYSNKPGSLISPQLLKTVKAGESIGSIIDIVKASDNKYWAQVSWGGWFNFNAYAPVLLEKKLPQTELTDEQKKEVLLNIVKLSPNGQAVSTIIDVGGGVIDTATSALDFVGWFGRNLKTILITGAVGVGLVYGYKIYKEIKS